MGFPQTSLRAIEKWGRYPHKQNSVVMKGNDVLSTLTSGVLYLGTGSTVNASVGSVSDGVSYVFDARGGTVNVSLPAGEQTSDGSTSVSITAVASLTRAAGVWTYAGN